MDLFLPGADKVRPLLRHYTQGIDLAMFILDGDSPASVRATHDELHLLAAGAGGAAVIDARMIDDASIIDDPRRRSMIDARVPIRVVATAHHRPKVKFTGLTQIRKLTQQFD